MDVYKAKKISSGSKTWLQKWRKKRDKIKVFLSYYDLVLNISQEAIQTYATDGNDNVIFTVVLADRETMYSKAEARVSSEDCENLADDAVFAVVKELKNKGFRASFKKVFGNVNNYYDITVDWKDI